jgi:hypothetical protein
MKSFRFLSGDKLEVGKYSQETKISDMCMSKNERMNPFHPAPCVYRRSRRLDMRLLEEKSHIACWKGRKNASD